MKKLAVLILPLAMLFACQTKQEPAKTEAAQEKTKDTTMVVNNEKPMPAGQFKDINPPSEEQKELSALAKQGLERIKAKDYAQGVDYLTRALELDPKNAKIHFNRGVGYYYMNDFNKALQDFNTSLQLKPNDTITLYHSGLARFYLKDFNGAINDFTQAINLSKKFSRAYYNRGLAKGQLKNYQGAVDDLTQAIICDATYGEAYYNRGYANFMKHDTMNACFDFIQANRMGVPQAKQAVELYCEKYNR